MILQEFPTEPSTTFLLAVPNLTMLLYQTPQFKQREAETYVIHKQYPQYFQIIFMHHIMTYCFGMLGCVK
jgi:hypothetical protein